MCLSNLTTNKAIIAKKNIICWKNLNVVKYRNGGRSYYSPYQQSYYELGVVKRANMNTGVKLDPVEIHVGLHTYSTRGIARRQSGDVTLKAIIPKGSKYWIGEFRGVPGYASNQLKVLKPKKHKRK